MWVFKQLNEFWQRINGVWYKLDEYGERKYPYTEDTDYNILNLVLEGKMSLLSERPGFKEPEFWPKYYFWTHENAFFRWENKNSEKLEYYVRQGGKFNRVGGYQIEKQYIQHPLNKETCTKLEELLNPKINHNYIKELIRVNNTTNK